MTWLFSVAIMLGSCLLFLVQPLCAKMLLPHLGGTPAVWTTCMLFFQAGLLLGYAYAHYGPRWLGVVPHAFVHAILLVVAFFTLPIGFPTEVPSDWHPVIWLLGTLTVNVGLPFVLVAAQAPLLQRWFVSTRNPMPGQPPIDPYFLYAASNLGSFLALALFPFALEPWQPLASLSEGWKIAFLVLAGVTACCVPLRVTASEPLTGGAPASDTPSRASRSRWIILAMIPSSLLLSVTTYATTDIAPIPLLWLVPMAIYLLTFVVAFSGRPLVPHALLLRWLPLVVLVLAFLWLCERPDPMIVVLALHLIGFFWLAMLCHGELARTRPSATYLTTFYLCLALGGVLGGLFNAIVAPLLLPDLLEYPLMIVLACYFAQNSASRPNRLDGIWSTGVGILTVFLILVFQSEIGITIAPGPVAVGAMFALPLLLTYSTQAVPTRFALCMAVVLGASWLYHGVHGASLHRERSWFGVHRVTALDGFHRLVHGNTVHGQQDQAHQEKPLTYYGREGPAGDVFQTLRADARLKNVGIVGLGAGSLAAYADAEQAWTFFEIDPSVIRIAENPKFFTFIPDARRRADIKIELGDARLQLKKSTQQFGVLVVDAFGSDAIPLHLLTREALRIYLDRLAPTGVLAFHVSNRYVDLEPVLANLAADHDPPLACYINDRREISKEARSEGVWASAWMVLARRDADLEPILRRPGWRPARPDRSVGVWTDQSSNLLRVFRWSTDD